MALQIHSVEPRHALAVRPIVGKLRFICALDQPKTKAQVSVATKPFLA